MLSQHKLLVASFALLAFSASVSADSVYVTAFSLVTGNQQFGTVDLGTGAFQQIRSAADQDFRGLIPASNGSLLTLGFDANLASINPVTGLPTVIGPTGLSEFHPKLFMRIKIGKRLRSLGRKPLCNGLQSKPLSSQSSNRSRNAGRTYGYTGLSIPFPLQ